MRASRVVSISLPPAMFKEAERRARRDRSTMSELFRQAFRVYERQRAWDELRQYGRETVERLGIGEEEIVSLIKQLRRERRRRKVSA
jgi:metal-responsive CopG/Arc/MetJ family transcriptional regulator